VASARVKSRMNQGKERKSFRVPVYDLLVTSERTLKKGEEKRNKSAASAKARSYKEVDEFRSRPFPSPQTPKALTGRRKTENRRYVPESLLVSVQQSLDSRPLVHQSLVLVQEFSEQIWFVQARNQTRLDRLSREVDEELRGKEARRRKKKVRWRDEERRCKKHVLKDVASLRTGAVYSRACCSTRKR